MDVEVPAAASDKPVLIAPSSAPVLDSSSASELVHVHYMRQADRTQIQANTLKFLQTNKLRTHYPPQLRCHRNTAVRMQHESKKNNKRLFEKKILLGFEPGTPELNAQCLDH